MAKKIEGYGLEATESWSTNRPTGSTANWQKSTLVIGDERVFTESEVMAMLQSAITQVGFIEPEVRLIAHFKKFGFVLDPA